MEQATKGASDVTKQMIKNANGNTIALDKMTLGAKAASVGLKALSIAGNMLMFWAITEGIQLAIKALDKLILTTEEAKEALDNSVSSFQGTTDELNNLESELETTSDRLRELQKLAENNTISIAEERELELLKQQNDELERKIALKKEEQVDAAKQVLKDAKKYSDKEVMSSYAYVSGTYEQGAPQYDSISAADELSIAFDKYYSSTNRPSANQQNPKDVIENMYAVIEPTIEAYEALIDADYKLSNEEQAHYDKLRSLQDRYLQYRYDLNGLKETYQALSVEQQKNILLNKLTAQGLSDIQANAVLDSVSESDYASLWEKGFSFTPPQMTDYATAEEYGKAYANAWLNGVKSGVDAANETDILSFSDAWNSEDFENARKELLSLAEAGQLTPETLQSTEEYKTLLEQTGLSAEEAAKKINSMTDASTQLQSMSAQISKMSDMLADKKNGTTASASDLAGFDATVKGLESWAEFERVMGSSKSSMEECQAAADALATEWVNNSNFLANLTEENKDYYIQQLKMMGVENAEIVVLKNLEKVEAQDFLAKKDLNVAAQDAYEGLIKEGEGAGISKLALIDLIAQEQVFNSTGLSVSGKISQLSALASAYLGTAAAAKFAASTSVSGMGSDSRYYTDSYVQDQWKNALGDYKIDFDISPTGSSGYKGSSSKSGGSNSKTTIDWIERKLDVLQKKIDQTKAKFDNLFTLKDKKNNLNEQIKLTQKLLTTTEKSANRYLKAANKVGLSDSLKKKVQNGSYDINDYDSKTSDAITKYKDYYDKYKELKQQADELETDIRGLRIDRQQLYVDQAEAKIAKSQAYAENGKANYKNQNSHLEYQKKQIKESYYYQIKMAELEGDMIKADQLRAERKKALNDVTKQEFDNIKETFDYQIDHIDDRIDDLTNAISAVENKGFIANASYYNAQASVHEEILGKLESEKKKLREQLKTIKKQTPAWYEAVQSIQDVDNQIAETTNKISEMKNAINGVADTLSGNIIDSFHDLNEEADTLITLLGDNLSDDKLGNLTKEGIAALGLYSQQMNVSKASAENIQNEIQSIQDAINNGTYTKFIDANGMERQFESIYQAKDRIKELQESYRSEIQNTYQYESKIVDLMKQKYQSELNYVKELIDKKKELLSAEQDLYQYSRDIKNQVDGINSIKKQLSALQGDTSLENKSRVQKLEKQLKDQQDDLKDKEYERYISDTQNMLDNLSAEYQQLIESVSKDRDTLLKEGNQIIASNGTQIQQTINETASEYGYQMSETMTSATSQITSGLFGIKSVLDSIETYLKDRVVNTSGDGAGGGNVEDYTPAGQIKSVLENGSNKNPTSSLAKAVSEAFGVGLNRHEMAQISGLLGLGYKYEDFLDSSSKKAEAKNAVLEALVKEGYLKKSGGSYIRGYAKGGVISSYADAIRLNGDKVLISGKPGERMLTEKQNENFEKFTDALPDLVNLTDIIKPNVNIPTAIDRNIGGITYGGNNQINIELPNVTNYEDFMRKFQNDPKAEQLVQHMTASALNGSRLGKNTIRF